MLKNYQITTHRLKLLRDQMQRENISAVIVPSSDPHLSENIPKFWKCRQWVSGFTGSAGILVVTQYKASLWTDSRYWEQASKQLENTGIEMCKVNTQNSISYLPWLISNTKANDIVLVNGYLVSSNRAEALESELKIRNRLIKYDLDIFNNIWENRPPQPTEKLFVHELEYADITRKSKIETIKEKMSELGATWHLLSSLDDIAWVLNLRGSDIEYTPVFISYLLIGPKYCIFAVDKNKVSNSIEHELESSDIKVVDYKDIAIELDNIESNCSLLLDKNHTSYALYQRVKNRLNIVDCINPTQILKAKKTKNQIQHLRKTMCIDGAAFCNFQAWFDEAYSNNEILTELDIAEKIEEYRKANKNYISPSFATIAGFNKNGSLPHYQATEENYSVIDKDGILLIDTGGQYLSGTTDMTRVIPVGIPLEQQKKDFTYILKAVIALSQAHYPESIPGALLDSIARNPLWKLGLDYGHGTGHGVGFFLNVHEGPQAISFKSSVSTEHAMRIGMITSIEPGLYRQGKWGIRIENLVVNQLADKTEFGEFLKFEILTVCPIDTRCIVFELLNDQEIQWLNDYHQSVREKLLPLVNMKTKQWLIQRTKPIN